MDYTNFYWLEALPLLTIIPFLLAVYWDVYHADPYERGMWSFIIGVFVFLPVISIPIEGFCLPNSKDDAKCQIFLENCDRELVSVRRDWPKCSVEYEGVTVFPMAVRRNSHTYWTKFTNDNSEINNIINEVVKKGLEVK